MGTQRYRWHNKRKPMPKWLAEGEARVRQRTDVSFRYWLKLWYATPLWATRAAVVAIYEEAHRRRQAGENVVVDHIVPLKSPWVCGLHCETNLQIITEPENYEKSNHTWPDRADEDEQIDMFAREYQHVLSFNGHKVD